MPVIVPSYTKSGLPAPGNAGTLARVSDSPGGLWMDTGTQWVGINGEVANVRDFGAAGNGSTDDTAAIQDALSSCGVIFFPPGTYATSSTLTVQGQRTLLGLDYSTTIIRYSGTGDGIK